MPKIAILLGTSRDSNNGHGLAAWLKSHLESRLNDQRPPDAELYTVVVVDPSQPPLPLGPVVDGTRIPAQITDPAQYASPAVREWSAFVRSAAAFVILTPQYNWSFPGELKNSLDHLYSEWRGKPVLLVTYGGHGGNKCAAALRPVLEGGLHARVVPKGVEIVLPRNYIQESVRVSKDGPLPDFLEPYVAQVHEAVDQLKEILAAPPE